MPGYIPDDFWIQGSNITIGTNGVDDGAASTTFPSFKNDVEFTVGPAAFVSDTQPALTYDSSQTAIPMRTLAASATNKVLVPFPEFFLRTYVPTAGVTNGVGDAATSKGILIKTLSLRYRANTTTLTSITGAIYYKAFATEATLGAVTTPTVVVSGGTLTAAANVYTLLLTVSTPFVITATGSMPWAVVTVVVPGSSTCDLFEATWGCGLGIY